jgi:tetratricopeptide (TPR) repeat protein
LDAALDHFEQALPIVREVGDRAVEAATLSNIGAVHHDRGALDAALEYFQQGVALEEAVAHPDLDRHREVLEALRAQLRSSNS